MGNNSSIFRRDNQTTEAQLTLTNGDGYRIFIWKNCTHANEHI